MINQVPIADYETFVQQIMQQWHIPGLAIAVVKDDQVILCRGFGLRDISRDLPVTADTLFPIASCTKAFTALALGMLVEESRIAWDTPLREYLPDFCLFDEFATQRLTPCDLLCHRSGLPGYDMLWYASDFSRQEIYRRLRYLEPTCDLRTNFQYQNLMFIVAGLLVERVTGESWETFVRERIFTPLGMRRSGFSTRLLQQDPDHSRPYYLGDGETQEIPFFEVDGEKGVTGAAGSIVSCASDLSNWVLFQLQGGGLGEKKLVSSETLQKMHQPHIFADDPAGRKRYGFEFSSAGLGWFLRMHKGELLVSHDGIADGFASFVALLPRRSLGIALLSNLDFSLTNFGYPLGILAFTLFDRLSGLEPTDWATQEKALFDEILRAAPTNQKPENQPSPGSANLPSFEAYIGAYEHPAFGILSIQQTGQALSISLNGKVTLALLPKRPELFEVTDPRFGKREPVHFTLDDQGKITALSLKIDPVAKEVVFTRVMRKEKKT